jgi:hypothetical protein
LAACGDLDGDGFDDVAACAPYTDPGGIFNSGTAAVFYGGPVPTVVASGCAGAASPSPKAWFTGDCPRVGGSKFAVTLSDAAPGSAAAFGIGPPSPSTWPGIPLAAFGLPGCMYRVVPILLVGATVGAGGTSTLPAPIPNVPALAGLGFDCQWVVFALPGSLASVSDVVRIEIGP